ncbi:SPFH domain-containing protein [Sphingobacterium daejeonense]|uniref:SPFH domain-containing protein n=1 Tax=Sphingobacterium daejeonense TaxID=371142 RepID=UPI0010C3FD7E|nr:SPFH domain-containing protein [Sphingobacterium daejeonense]VTP97411.1 Uncharacterised protein [Sphingobacterium daejeonense]
MEKIIKPTSGYLALVFLLLSILGIVFSFIQIAATDNIAYIALVAVLFVVFIVIIKGLIIVNPNHSRVLNLFGNYVGTIKANGLFFINPFYTAQKISLRSENLQGQTLKVNDKLGNPIEIAAVIVWKIGDTYKAAYDVQSYMDYVRVQSEAAVRHLAVSFCI